MNRTADRLIPGFARTHLDRRIAVIFTSLPRSGTVRGAVMDFTGDSHHSNPGPPTSTNAPAHGHDHPTQSASSPEPAPRDLEMLARPSPLRTPANTTHYNVSSTQLIDTGATHSRDPNGRGDVRVTPRALRRDGHSLEAENSFREREEGLGSPAIQRQVIRGQSVRADDPFVRVRAGY
jgi:hypothetical protein